MKSYIPYLHILGIFRSSLDGETLNLTDNLPLKEVKMMKIRLTTHLKKLSLINVTLE